MAEPDNSTGRSITEAERALAGLGSGPARNAAEDLAQAFDRTGARIAASLARAARSGELSFRQLAKAALQELTKLTLNSLFDGSLGKGLAAALQKLPFFGARATGGPVVPGGAYLVGERGPELFTPNSAGAISPQSGGAMIINFNFSGPADAQSFRRDQGQIAAALARAVAYGRRNL